jgi:hypothetical protein
VGAQRGPDAFEASRKAEATLVWQHRSGSASDPRRYPGEVSVLCHVPSMGLLEEGSAADVDENWGFSPFGFPRRFGRDSHRDRGSFAHFSSVSLCAIGTRHQPNRQRRRNSRCGYATANSNRPRVPDGSPDWVDQSAAMTDGGVAIRTHLNGGRVFRSGSC